MPPMDASVAMIGPVIDSRLSFAVEARRGGGGGATAGVSSVVYSWPGTMGLPTAPISTGENTAGPPALPTPLAPLAPTEPPALPASPEAASPGTEGLPFDAPEQ